jgi:hypothetical protein
MVDVLMRALVSNKIKEDLLTGDLKKDRNVVSVRNEGKSEECAVLAACSEGFHLWRVPMILYEHLPQIATT